MRPWRRLPMGAGALRCTTAGRDSVAAAPRRCGLYSEYSQKWRAASALHGAEQTAVGGVRCALQCGCVGFAWRRPLGCADWRWTLPLRRVLPPPRAKLAKCNEIDFGNWMEVCATARGCRELRPTRPDQGVQTRLCLTAASKNPLEILHSYTLPSRAAALPLHAQRTIQPNF